METSPGSKVFRSLLGLATVIIVLQKGNHGHRYCQAAW